MPKDKMEVNKQRNGDVAFFNLPYCSLRFDVVAPGIDIETNVSGSEVKNSEFILKGPVSKKLLAQLASEFGMEVVPIGTLKELKKLQAKAAKR